MTLRTAQLSAIILFAVFSPVFAFAACTSSPGGNLTVSADCAFSNSVDGVDNGDIIVDSGVAMTLNAGQTIVLNPGKNLVVNGSIVLNATALIKKTYLWMVDQDGDGYPTTLTQYAQDTAPVNGRRRYLMTSVTVSDCDDGTASATNDCGQGLCGNGVIDGTEECDDGGLNGLCPAGCSDTCTMNTCMPGGGGACCTGAAHDVCQIVIPENCVSGGGTWYGSPSCSPDPCAADNIPPSVSITAPSNGATVSGTISVSANASDNVGVMGVQFKLDGGNLGAEDTASPYAVSWDTTGASNGSRSLTAVARDAAGNSTTSAAVNVTVSNGGGPCNSWTATTPLPVGSSAGPAQHEGIAYNGYVYVLGGIYSLDETSTVYYAPITATGGVGTWQTTTPLPITIKNHSAFEYNGYMYVTGGWDYIQPGGPANYYDDVYYARIGATGTLGNWISTTRMKKALFGHQAFAYNGKIYGIGGSNAQGQIANAYYATINPDGSIGIWSTGLSLPQVLGSHEAFATSGYAYVFGGTSEADGGYETSTVLYASISSSTGALGAWTTTTPLGAATFGHSAFAYNSKAYIVGGRYGPGIRYTSTVLSAPLGPTGTLGAWSAVGNLPTGSYIHAAFTNNGDFYKIGGYPPYNNSVYVSPACTP